MHTVTLGDAVVFLVNNLYMITHAFCEKQYQPIT